MTLVKKVNDLWQPSENPGLKIGETMEVTDYERLVKGGMAVLVDETGNELELPGQVFTCPICFTTHQGLSSFHEHIATHLQKNKENMEAQVAALPEKKTEAEELKEKVEEEVKKQNAENKPAKSGSDFAERMKAAKAKKAQERAEAAKNK